MDIISRMMLRTGKYLELAPGVVVRHPTVGDVLEINHGFLCEDYYWNYVFTVLSDPYDFMVYLDDHKIDYEQVTAFDVFLMRWNDARKDYLENREKYLQLGISPASVFDDALSFFFGHRKFYFGKVGDYKVIADEADPHWMINEDAFQLATQFITQCNCIVREDKIKPATKSAKRILIEDKRMEERKQKSRFHKKEEKVERIAEAMAAIDAGVGLIESYDHLPVYRLLSTARGVQKRVVVQSILNGIHTGMIKADGVPDKTLRWAEA